jgi:RNA polymerase-binding transcription factor DksA
MISLHQKGFAMPPLNTQELETFEGRLGKRREELRWIIHDALIESKREDFRELAGAVHDAGEESVADLLEGINQTILNREVEELIDVEAALRRISIGSYGVCIDCGDEIDRERLNAYPTAKRCVACQNRRESEKRGGPDITPSL